MVSRHQCVRLLVCVELQMMGKHRGGEGESPKVVDIVATCVNDLSAKLASCESHLVSTGGRGGYHQLVFFFLFFFFTFFFLVASARRLSA